MKDSETWIEEIETDIARLKNKKLTSSYFNFSVEMSDATPAAIVNYFSKDKGFSTEVKRCPRNRYDIIITW